MYFTCTVIIISIAKHFWYAGLLTCYLQPRADDLLGTYCYQSLSSVMDAEQNDAATDPQISDGVVRRWRVVVAWRMLVLAAVCVILAVGIVCRLSV